MLNAIRNMTLVRCREVVHFSEGPLSEARLYQPDVQLLVGFLNHFTKSSDVGE